MSSCDAKRKYLVIDTDCGVDDALAILLALSTTDQHDILAFTSVFGNTSAENAATNVRRLTKAANKAQIPVYVGCGQAISLSGAPLDTSEFHGNDGFGGVSELYPTSPNNPIQKECSAVALCKLAQQYPGQITVIALGPLTNLAVAHLIDSNFSNNLKEVCVMGGNIDGIGNVTVSAEFNFYCDPEAALHVIDGFKCPVTVVPWELSFRQALDWEWYFKWIKHNTKTAKIIRDVTKSSTTDQWVNSYPDGIPVPDLLAVALTLFPEVIEESINEWVSVELTGTLTRGMMVVDRRRSEPDDKKPKPKNKIQVINRINLEKLKMVLTPMTTQEWIK